MTLLKNIARAVTQMGRKRSRVARCQRCLRGDEARYYVHSEIIHIAVCAACADEALKIGLAVEPIHSKTQAA